MERKTYPCEFKVVDLDDGTFEGHASIFNVPDDGIPPDIMMPGAFGKTIQEWGPSGKNRIKILAMHASWELPIGKPTVLAEDELGLFFRGKISNTTKGRDVLTLMRDGVLTEMSIGFETIKREVDKPSGMRRVHEVRLFEISPVIWAMHPDALITGVKALAADLRRSPELLTDEMKAELSTLSHLALPTSEPDPSTPTDPAAAVLARDPEVLQSLRIINATLSETLTLRRRSGSW